MRHFIEGSHRYYFNDETLKIEFCTIKNKYKERDVLDDGICLYSNISMINTVTNRKKNIKISISDCIFRFILKNDLTNCDIISYKDNDYHNLSLENIYLSKLDDICSNWCDLVELSNMYKLSSSGLIYNCFLHHLIIYTNNNTYFKFHGYFVHHLVWKYFGSSPYKESMVIDHIDNNIYNNDITNLQLISQNINIKKERKVTKLSSNLSITYNNKTYYLCKRYSHTLEECEIIYNTALKYAQDGCLDDYFCKHDYIHYDFLRCGWCIINLPNKCSNFVYDKNILFSSYDLCLCYFNDILKQCGLEYHIIGSLEYYISRNKISFKINNKVYTFTLLKNNLEFSTKVVNYYLEHGKYKFHEKLDDFLQEKEHLLASKKQNISSLKEGTIHPLNKNINYSSFNEQINFTYKNNIQTYVFNIPYNGDYYYLGCVCNEKIVKDVNEIIQSQKSNKDFLGWLKLFQDTEFKRYQEQSEKERIKIVRDNSKGYYYFKPKDKWDAKINYNGKRYRLGYFNYEEEASYIYKEAVNMIEFGVFEKWYVYIKEHRERIKYLFES